MNPSDTSTRASRATRRRGTRVGLALAGGGPLGAIWEIGALCALDKVLDDPVRRLVTYMPRSAPAWHDVAPHRLGARCGAWVACWTNWSRRWQ
jgi:hypothetical protein